MDMEHSEGLYDLFMFWYGFKKIRRSICDYTCNEAMIRWQWDNIWFAKTTCIDKELNDIFGCLIPCLKNYNPVNDFEVIAKMVLYDQIVRNVYRYSPKAYEYDSIARELAHCLLKNPRYSEFPLCIKVTILLTLVHSECLDDHMIVEQQLSFLQYHNSGILKTLTEIAKRHHLRIAMFGRFPEREVIKGTILTEEETIFLNNVS
jgi:uncharacterized protein (DUF924 family)